MNEFNAMNEFICAACFNNVPLDSSDCPSCGGAVVWEGGEKSIIDRMEPNCLIHRYDGSDMLEAAFLVKEARSNCKVATKLKEYAKPFNVPKEKVYKFDDKILGAIKALRNERSAAMHRYDMLIKSHWDKLKPYDN